MGFGAINVEEAKAEGRKPLELCRTQRKSYIKIEATVKIDQAKLKKNEKDEMDEKFGLPDVWNRNTQQRTKTDQCSVCESPFSMVAMFGVGNRDFFCK